MPERHPHVLAELRDAIRRIERRPARRQGVLATGLPEVDAALPGGGFPRGALSELTGGPASGKTAVALALFAALGPRDLYAWVDARGELYPPAAAARGVDLARLLLVRPGSAVPARAARDADSAIAATRDTALAATKDTALAALWAAEALLASGAFAVVAVDVPSARLSRGADAAAKRLQAAAERGGAVGLWLAGPGAAVRIPAAVRLELSAEGGRILARRSTGGGGAGGGVPVKAAGGRSGHAA